MSQHDHELADDDLLLEFSTEPALTPAPEPEPVETAQPAASEAVAAQAPSPAPSSELVQSLTARIDQLERTLDRSASQAATLKSEVATLVGVIDDIRKKVNRPVPASMAPPPRVSRSPRRAVSAIAGVVLGIALGILGWMTLSRDSIDAIGTASSAEVVQQPVEPAAPPQPVITVASAPVAPAPGRIVPAHAVVAESPAPERVGYVGTLSIDAAPGGQVFINRKAAGHTPLRVPNLRAGSHLIWIERDGYQRFTRVVQVPANQVSRVWADLEPLAAR